jgi:hypothetical protein
MENEQSKTQGAPVAVQGFQPLLAGLATICATLLGTSTMVSPIRTGQDKILAEMLEFVKQNQTIAGKVNTQLTELSDLNKRKLEEIGQRLEALEKRQGK